MEGTTDNDGVGWILLFDNTWGEKFIGDMDVLIKIRPGWSTAPIGIGGTVQNFGGIQFNGHAEEVGGKDAVMGLGIHPNRQADMIDVVNAIDLMSSGSASSEGRY